MFGDFFLSTQNGMSEPATMGNTMTHRKKNRHLFFSEQIKHFQRGLVYKANKTNRNATAVKYFFRTKSHTSSHVVNRNANTLNQMLNKRLSTVIPFEPLRWEKLGERKVDGHFLKMILKLKHLVILNCIHMNKPTNETELSPSLRQIVTCHLEFDAHCVSIHHSLCDRNSITIHQPVIGVDTSI